MTDQRRNPWELRISWFPHNSTASMQYWILHKYWMNHHDIAARSPSRPSLLPRKNVQLLFPNSWYSSNLIPIPYPNVENIKSISHTIFIMCREEMDSWGLSSSSSSGLGGSGVGGRLRGQSGVGHFFLPKLKNDQIQLSEIFHLVNFFFRLQGTLKVSQACAFVALSLISCPAISFIRPPPSNR